MRKNKNTPTITQWRVVGVLPGLIHWKGVNYDLSSISDQVAEKLINEGCSYLEWVIEEPVNETTNPE